MKPLEYAYNMSLKTAGRFLIAWLQSSTRQDPVFHKGRLGFYDTQCWSAKKPRLWFHAASVGEVTGATAILHHLHERLPHAGIYLTVATQQGFNFARTHLPGWTQVLPFPLDFPEVLDRAYQYLQPDAYIALESEFWPNLFRLLRNRQVPTLLLNGRLSSRSAQFYNLVRPLFQPIFAGFCWLAMHSAEDMRNAIALGAIPERTVVLGSAKYEGLLAKADQQKAQKWRTLLSVSPDVPVLIGGSLRRSECIELLRVFHALANHSSPLLGLFAPRHLHQVPHMARWLQQHDIPFQYLSQLEQNHERRVASAILVDRIGVLFELYALGDLIFCGGTLEPIGGHNILEPAAWQKPVFYGPYLKKVTHEHKILQDFAGSFMARDGTQLQNLWAYWLERLPQLRSHGKGARQALIKLGGVATKQVELIVTTLSETGSL